MPPIDIFAEPELHKQFDLRAMAERIEMPEAAQDDAAFMMQGTVEVHSGSWPSVVHYVLIKNDDRVTCAFFSSGKDAESLAGTFKNSPLATSRPCKQQSAWHVVPA